jgi:hypothetical protein
MKEIKDRMDKGYTMSLYGTRELLHEQMLEDISSLLNLLYGRESQVETRIEYLTLLIEDLLNINCPKTAENYAERKLELQKLLKLWTD